MNIILTYIHICIAVLTDCQMNKNPCSNQRFTCCLNMSLNFELYMKSVANQTDHFTKAFVRENVLW